MTNDNNNRKGSVSELFPLLYSFFKGIEATRNADQEYQALQRQGIFDSNEEMTLQFAKTMISEVLRKYNLTEGNLLELIPPKYRSFAGILYSMQWDNVIELVANVAKEYGKDRETDQYRTTKAVVGDVLKQFIGNRILDEITK